MQKRIRRPAALALALAGLVLVITGSGLSRHHAARAAASRVLLAQAEQRAAATLASARAAVGTRPPASSTVAAIFADAIASDAEQHRRATARLELAEASRSTDRAIASTGWLLLLLAAIAHLLPTKKPRVLPPSATGRTETP